MTKCPHCGDVETSRNDHIGFVYYRCGAIEAQDPQNSCRSSHCLGRELESLRKINRRLFPLLGIGFGYWVGGALVGVFKAFNGAGMVGIIEALGYATAAFVIGERLCYGGFLTPLVGKKGSK